MAMQGAFDPMKLASRPLGAVAQHAVAGKKRKGSDGAFS
jgi:hypothetical protein